MSLLQTRSCLSIDDEHHVDATSPDVIPRLGPHFLDYTLYVGDRLGLDAALPNVVADHNWTAKLQLSMTHRLWPDSSRQSLPFNPKGRMIYIGSRLDDQLWLALAPLSFFNVHDPNHALERSPVLDAPSTTLILKHQLMLILFISFVLETMHHEDIACHPRYPEPLTWAAVKASTEVLYIYLSFHFLHTI